MPCALLPQVQGVIERRLVLDTIRGLVLEARGEGAAIRLLTEQPGIRRGEQRVRRQVLQVPPVVRLPRALALLLATFLVQQQWQYAAASVTTVNDLNDSSSGDCSDGSTTCNLRYGVVRCGTVWYGMGRYG